MRRRLSGMREGTKCRSSEMRKGWSGMAERRGQGGCRVVETFWGQADGSVEGEVMVEKKED